MSPNLQKSISSIFGLPVYFIVLLLGVLALTYMSLQPTRATGLPAFSQPTANKIEYGGDIFVQIVPGLYQREDLIDIETQKKYEDIRLIFASRSNKVAPPNVIKIARLGNSLAHSTNTAPPTSFDNCLAEPPKNPKHVTFICLSPVELNKSRNSCTTIINNKSQITAC